ncbi:g9782 [Coccomyxa viridis]|uniref:peptidyl-tRNA hydrolase n=1 Tax=Coccomyxa viridis TaxID=1274662 RepID=A0ABP1G6G5_9CHLO
MSLRSDHVKQLEDMGFSSQHAHRALTATHDCGTEAALGWLVENAAKLDQESDEQQHNIVSQPSEGPSTGVSSQPDPSTTVSGTPAVLGVPSALTVLHPDGSAEPCRMVGLDCKAVLVVNSTLKMSSGKIAAQCAHAAVGLYKNMYINGVPWLASWEEDGEKTVVLKSEGPDLQTLETKAESLLLPTFLVEDAGRTEIAPGSLTVLGIAGPNAMVNEVTGSLRTLQ